MGDDRVGESPIWASWHMAVEYCNARSEQEGLARSRAERLPGVKAVLTADNTPEVRIGFLRDNLTLKGGKVRAFRDEVAAVAATDPEIAAEAVELVRVEYEPLPAVFDPVEALAEGAPLVHETDPRGRWGLRRPDGRA